jgi:hypothetical protein
MQEKEIAKFQKPVVEEVLKIVAVVSCTYSLES